LVCAALVASSRALACRLSLSILPLFRCGSLESCTDATPPPAPGARLVERRDAFAINAELEFERNAERYHLLRWASQAFADFSVVPPDTGICHQVNLEYLSAHLAGHQA
jgi:hypothetical protein